MDWGTEIIKLLTEQGLTTVLIIYLLVEKFGPSIAAKVWPAWVASRNKVIDDKIQERKLQAEEDRRIEDRLFELMQASVASTSKLNYTLEHISAYMQGQSVLMRELSLDMARVYTVLRVDRPEVTALQSNTTEPPK